MSHRPVEATDIGVSGLTAAVFSLLLMIGCPVVTAAGSPATVFDVFQRPVAGTTRAGSIAPTPLAAPGGRETQSPAGGPLFHPYVIYPLASGAYALAIGDVTGDGLNDVVAVQSTLDLLYVFAQGPSGVLIPPVQYPVPIANSGMHSGSVDIADMNQDGRLDVVVSLTNAVGVMLQTAGGLLSGPIPYPTVHSSFSNPYKVRAGDFNHDGWPDAVSIDWGTQSQDVDVFRQAPAGTLMPPQVYTVLHGGYDDLEAGDVSGDGRVDLVVMSGQGFNDNLGVLVQNGSGGLDPPVYYDLGGDQRTSGVGIGDVNHDGRDDVVVSYGGNSPGSQIGVFLQGGAGILSPAFSLPSYDIPQPVEVGDLNLDGRDDVVTLHGGWRALGVYLQSGAGALEPEQLYPAPPASHYNRHALAIGDLNNDFMPDLAWADYNWGVVVLYNAESRPTPVLISLVSADAFPDRVELTWEVGAGPGTGTTIERTAAPGMWQAIGIEAVDAAHRVGFIDRDVEAGHRYGYRLRLNADGEDLLAGEVWVDVGAARALALHGARPNPSEHRLNVQFTLPVAAAATLEVVDLTGRRIVSRDVGALGAGTHTIDVTPGGALRPGVYWLRLTQGSDTRTTKAAVVE